MRKIISLILTLIMLGSTLIACKGEEASLDTTPANTFDSESPTVTEEPGPTVTDEKYDGSSFIFYYRREDLSEGERWIWTEEEGSEKVSAAIIERNNKVNEKFDIEIVAIDDTDVSTKIRDMVAAGMNDCDAISDCKTALAYIFVTGSLYNLRDIPYIQMTESYWDAKAYETLSIGNKTFMMPNDISMGNLAGVRFLYFNQQIVTDIGLTNPYDYFYSDTWTLDNFLTLVSSATEDLNGDSVYDANDRFGMLSEEGAYNGNILYFLKSSGITYTKADEDGYPELSVDIDKAKNIMDKVYAVFSSGNYVLSYESAASGQDVSNYGNIYMFGRRALFTSDHFLFVQNGTEEANVSFKNMKSDFGIMPNPKYDESQTEYYHRVDPFSLMMAVPNLDLDFEMVGSVLEYMAWLSSKTVLPAYYEDTIKNKRKRDEDTPVVLDAIKSSISYELIDAFDTNFTISGILWESYSRQNIASAFQKKQPAIDRVLESIVETLNNLD